MKCFRLPLQCDECKRWWQECYGESSNIVRLEGCATTAGRTRGERRRQRKGPGSYRPIHRQMETDTAHYVETHSQADRAMDVPSKERSWKTDDHPIITHTPTSGESERGEMERGKKGEARARRPSGLWSPSLALVLPNPS